MSETRTAQMEVLLPRIMPQVLPCPRSMALDAIQMVAVDFCKETGVWKEIFTETVCSCDVVIPVSVPRDAVLAGVSALYLDQDRVQASEYQVASRDIMLLFTPQNHASVTVEATLRPVRTAVTLPEEILEEWGDVIVHGVIARLKSMSGIKIEWTDPQGAVMHNELYNEGCAAAREQKFRRRFGGGIMYVNSGD